MWEAIGIFISKLSFMQAQVLIGEIFGGTALIIMVIAMLPRISNAKKINVKTGETEYYDDIPKPSRGLKKKVVK